MGNYIQELQKTTHRTFRFRKVDSADPEMDNFAGVHSTADLYLPALQNIISYEYFLFFLNFQSKSSYPSIKVRPNISNIASIGTRTYKRILFRRTKASFKLRYCFIIIKSLSPDLYPEPIARVTFAVATGLFK